MGNEKPPAQVPDVHELTLTSWIFPMLIVGVILLFGFILLHQIGLFPVPATAEGEKTLAAALVLIGTVITASVTFIGLVIKTSLDLRTANIAAMEAHRTHLLALESERRNRVDTVIRAVGLLGAGGKDATPHQISGALLALQSLGEHDLAVALAAHLWPHDLVSRRAVGRVITEAFRKGSPETQYLVAALMLENAGKLPGKNRFFMWPLSDMSWPGEALPVCRIALVIAAQRAFIAELRVSRMTRVPGSAAVLSAALTDGDAQVRNLAGAALRPFVETMPEDEWIHTGTKAVTVKEMKALTATVGAPDSTLANKVADLVSKLVKGEDPAPDGDLEPAVPATTTPSKWSYGVAKVTLSQLEQFGELAAAEADGWETLGSLVTDGTGTSTLVRKRMA